MTGSKEKDHPISLVEELLLAHRPQEALGVIDQALAKDSEAPVKQRTLLHLKGQALIHMDQIEEALRVMEAALESGSNVSLLRDLACGYYQAADMKKWRKTYQELARVLDSEKASISTLHRLLAQNILGKFYEEEGLIDKAVKSYEDTFAEARSQNRSDLIPVCLAQLIRVRALFGQSEGLGSLYTQLISLHEDQTSLDLQFEIHHSLMLAEMALIGPDHAWLRVEDSLRNESLCEADRRLMFYDFLEEMLLKELDLPATCFLWKDQLKGQDPFEREIHCLAFAPEDRKDFLSLGRLTPNLSWASYLRLLILYFRMAETPDKAAEIKNKVHLILDSLEPESRPFWVQRMKPPLEENRVVLDFEPESRLIQFENKQLNLSRKKGMLALLKLLNENREQSVEDVILAIWDSAYSPEYYHRLRMTAHRLNQLLFDLTAVPKIVEVNSDQVSLRPAVQFRSTEGSLTTQ